MSVTLGTHRPVAETPAIHEKVLHVDPRRVVHILWLAHWRFKFVQRAWIDLQARPPNEPIVEARHGIDSCGERAAKAELEFDACGGEECNNASAKQLEKHKAYDPASLYLPAVAHS